MKDLRKKKNTVDVDTKSAILYPGVAVDIAVDDKTSKKIVKDRTEILNNNPQNNGKLI